MAKKGMKRPQIAPKPPKNTYPPVPEIQGKAKHGKAPANPIIAGTSGPSQKVYHIANPATQKPPQGFWPYDNDLARDNLSNDTPAADLIDQ